LRQGFDMQYRALGSTGLKVSAVGFGASPLGGVFHAIDEAEGRRAVHVAVDLGINFIDVSPFYGLTRAEKVLGEALRDIPRERYLLATKVGRYGHEAADFDFSAGRVLKSIDESLQRLGVDHVDLIQCHDIEFGDLNQVVQETIPALRQAVERGKARFVGITGLPLKVFSAVIDRTTVDTILSYCHYALNDSTLERLFGYLHEKQIGVISASPLAMGLLTERGAPSWHPAPAIVKERCAAAAAHCRAKGADIAKLAFQFAVANPQIATTLVGTSSPTHITNNVRWASEPLDEGLLAEVLRILAPIHNQTWASGRPENN
jgi:L-galactose dehydrogenase